MLYQPITYFNPGSDGIVLSCFSFSKFNCIVTGDFLRNNTIVPITAAAMIRRAAKTLDTDAARTVVEGPADEDSVEVSIEVSVEFSLDISVVSATNGGHVYIHQMKIKISCIQVRSFGEYCIAIIYLEGSLNSLSLLTLQINNDTEI